MNTKPILGISLAAFFAVSMIFASGTLQAQALTGNGAPNGAHYNLNLIGMKKTDKLPNDANNGHRIFVKLYGTSKIYLTEGDFTVLDADATDSNGGGFQLPAPCADGTGTVSCGPDSNANPSPNRSYWVYARELGKPGGSATMTTCFTDPATNIDYCLLGYLSVPLQRDPGKSTFTNVTKELTTLCFDSDLGTVGIQLVCEDIFTDSNKDYFWNYDNNGLRVAQLRFYEATAYTSLFSFYFFIKSFHKVFLTWRQCQVLELQRTDLFWIMLNVYTRFS